jgi:hypothetical protein
MLYIASRLSEDFDFVRADLYNIGRICFGELTFTPAGSLKIQPKGWDLKLGKKWEMTSTGIAVNSKKSSLFRTHLQDTANHRS